MAPHGRLNVIVVTGHRLHDADESRTQSRRAVGRAAAQSAAMIQKPLGPIPP